MTKKLDYHAVQSCLEFAPRSQSFAFGLTPCRLNLLAIRTNNFRLCRPYANPLWTARNDIVLEFALFYIKFLKQYPDDCCGHIACQCSAYQCSYAESCEVLSLVWSKFADTAQLNGYGTEI